MVKVLMIGSDSTVKGGITSIINQIMSHDWNKEGVDIKFIPTYIEKNNFKKLFFFAKAYLKIQHELKINRPDVVHIHMSYRGSFTRKYLIHRLCKKNNIPDIIHLHGSELKKWYDEVNDKKKSKIRTLLREANTVIVLGKKWNSIIKDIEPTTNTVVVSNTVPIPKDTVSWDEPFRILFLGVLIKRKGVSDLLRATKILKTELGHERFKVLIAGSGSDEEKLKTEAIAFDISDVVEFLGWIDGEKKEKLLKNSQMLVLPSYNEGLPIAILEAMSYGMPIVATNVGDISSVVINGKNGYLLEPGDITNLAQLLSSIIQRKDVYHSLSSKSKSICTKYYSEGAFFDKLKGIYVLYSDIEA